MLVMNISLNNVQEGVNFYTIVTQNSLQKFEIGVASCYTEAKEPIIMKASVKALVVSISIKGTPCVIWHVYV